jgi:hypothetical protein
MIDHAETLMDEVRQLRTQYVNEVGSGRRVWPRSIKTRILELEQVGIPPKIIAAKTGVPSETIASWRFHRRHGVDKGFHALAVKSALPEIAKSGTVTVTTNKMSKNSDSILVTLPDGLRIESVNVNAIVTILCALKVGSSSCS